jgi:methionyl-tRNA formyltransferase
VGQWAIEHDVEPVLKPAKFRDESFQDRLRELNADAFVVVAFRILPESVFMIPRYCFNLHASLLPKYRGAAPIQRAIMAGETKTGVTTFLLQKTVDTGAILGRRSLDIAPKENAGELESRLSLIGRDLVIETLDQLEAGELAPEPQDENAGSPAPKIGRDDQRLDFGNDARSLINQVRAMAPRPGTVARLGGRHIKIFALTHAGSFPEDKPETGTVVDADPRTGLVVAARDRLVRIETIQPEGKKAQSGAEYVRGYKVRPGDRIEIID